MTGPPPTVKAASPLPNSHFSAVPTIGPAFDAMYAVPTVFQHHTGMPTVLLPSNPSSPLHAIGLPEPVANRFGGAWLNVWTYWRDRFRSLQAIPGPGAVPGG